MERRVGRAARNNDVYLIDDGRMLNISREHFLIEKNDDGSFTLLDRMSACGTFVGGKAGEKRCHGSSCPLADGDIIIVGVPTSPYIFKFSIYDE
jgi:hypothetical protein